jgi:S-(hydroxymethyl)glutathione dehydrogenase / alcohol dehydrogenase
VVIGAGGVGLNAIQGARIAGARRIVAVDMTEGEARRRTRLRRHRRRPRHGRRRPGARSTAILGRGADAVFVTVGAIPAFEAAPRYLATGGRVWLVGMPASGAMASYEPVMIAATGQGMIGSKMGDAVIARDIPWMIDLYRRGA